MLPYWVQRSVDGVISKTSCLLQSLVLTPSASNTVGDCTLYDGESTNDSKIIKVFTGTGQTVQLIFDPPIKAFKGLYLDVGSNVDSVLIIVKNQ